MNKTKFKKAIKTSATKIGQEFEEEVKDYENLSFGIFAEKSLHRTLKNYIDDDLSHQEVKLGKSIVDIFDGKKITEIQTRDFNSVRKKLPSLLKEYPVEIVFPVIKTKYLCWVDLETGEISKKRLSNKHASSCEILPHIYSIRNLLPSKNLSFRVVSLGATEYRFLDGWSDDKKKGSHRAELVPFEIYGETKIKTKSDYKKLLLEIGIDEKANETGFTSKDFSKASKLSIAKARTSLLVLTKAGAVLRVGKKSNAILYNFNNK